MNTIGPRWLDRWEADAAWANFVTKARGQTVFCDRRTGLWYHCDESFADLRGPYGTRHAAEQACREYAESL